MNRTSEEREPRGFEQYTAGSRRVLEGLGDQLIFYGKAYGQVGVTLTRYRKEVLRQIGAITFGTGALALVGGTAVVVGLLNLSTGTEVQVQGFNALDPLSLGVLTGFFSAYVNTRISVPLVAAVALVATVGAGITAELGARRIGEEIDALEVMAVPPIPYLVTSRIVAGMLAITPLYAIALFLSYAGSRLTAVTFYGVSSGAYDHYFRTFLIPSDVVTSYVEVLVMSVVIVSVHCYYGYHVTGGPAEVGTAVGRSVRLSLVLVLMVQFALTLLLFGGSGTLRISR